MVDLQNPAHFRRMQIATHVLAAIIALFALAGFMNGSVHAFLAIVGASVSGPFELFYRSAHPVFVAPVVIALHVLLFRLFLCLRRKWIAWAVLGAFAVTWNSLVLLYSVYAGIG